MNSNPSPKRNMITAFFRTAPVLCLLAALLPQPAVLGGSVVVDYLFSPQANLPDVGLLTDTRNVRSGITNIQKVSVYLKIGTRGSGGFNGELFAMLTHSNKTAVLLNRPGTEFTPLGDHFGFGDTAGMEIVLDDDATTDAHLYRPRDAAALSTPVTGTFQSDGRNPTDALVVVAPGTLDIPRNLTLAQFNGQAAGGGWSLTLADEGAGGTLHSLASWGLRIVGEAPLAGETLLGSGARITATGDTTFGSSVELGGALTVDGTGSVIFTGPASMTGSLDIKADILTIFRGGLTESGGRHGLVKTGLGVLVIEGEGHHRADTTVLEGTLLVHSRLGSAFSVASGATLGGHGTIGPVTLAAGATLSPGGSVGTLSTGSQTWAGGSSLLFQFEDASDSPEDPPGWDMVLVSGQVDVQASAANRVVVNVTTITSSSVAGAAAGFSNDASRLWPLVQASEGFLNFDPARLNLVTTGFLNDLGGGVFSLETNTPTTLSLRFTPNHAPATTPLVLTRSPGTTAKINLSDLLLNHTSDADGEARVITAMDTTGTGGGTLAQRGGFIFLTPLGDAPDLFSYTVRDDHVYRAGDTVRTAVGTIQIMVAAGASRSTITTLTPLGPAMNQISFAGIPGREYVVQFATNLTDSPWFDLSTNVAGLNGRWTLTDNTATNDLRIYRSLQK